jgi:acetyltransferase-like isoleucine patch superfamily enzyme
VSRTDDGSLAERARLALRARRSAAILRRPFRLPHPAGRRVASQITFGDGAYVGPGAWLNVVRDGRIAIGAGATIGPGVTIAAAALVEIGPGALLSARVSLIDHGHDAEGWILPALERGEQPRHDWALTDPSPVVVGAGTWIGINAVVLPGVTIGDGCIVGAGSVVTRDVAPGTVVAGTPARVLRAVGATVVDSA